MLTRPTISITNMFLSICPAICTSCLKKQKKKSEEHFGLMAPQCDEKDKEKTENQDLRFADKNCLLLYVAYFSSIEPVIEESLLYQKIPTRINTSWHIPHFSRQLSIITRIIFYSAHIFINSIYIKLHHFAFYKGQSNLLDKCFK